LDTGRIVAELKRERDRLSQAIAALEGQSPKAAAKRSVVPHRATHSKEKRDHLTPAGRKRLSEMMKKRWAEKRKKGSKGRQ
jgi:anti-sigma factor RsiW